MGRHHRLKPQESMIKKLDPEAITPMLAEKYLESVPDFQRKVDEKQVRKIALAIQKGEWRMNGATIVFNEKGELIDGQHRLKAIIMSCKTVMSLVVRGVPSDIQTFHTIGDEKSRKLTDFLRAKHINNVGAVLTMYWDVVNGHWPPGKGKEAYPIADVLKIGKHHIPAIEALCIDPLMKAGRLVHNASFCVFLAFYYTQIDPVKDIERLAEFFARVADGLELTRSHPAYHLRQKYLSLRPGDVIDHRTGKALIMKALHIYLQHEPCGRLQFRIESEPYPELLKSNEKEAKK